MSLIFDHQSSDEAKFNILRFIFYSGFIFPSNMRVGAFDEWPPHSTHRLFVYWASPTLIGFCCDTPDLWAPLSLLSSEPTISDSGCDVPKM